MAQQYLSNMVYNSRVHILEMLEDRGYDVEQYKNYTKPEILLMLREHSRNKMETKSEAGPLDILVSKNAGEKVEKVFIKYRLDDKFKKTDGLVKQINDIYDTNVLGKSDTMIILNIARVILKPGTKDKPDEEFSRQMFVTKGYFVQLFGLENFMFNVSRHELVPKHTVMSKHEIDEMMAKYSITNKHNLPTIKAEDPQSKYIGLRPHQVCKIEVTNLTSGVAVKYRYCTL
jgi:DNA-directed RNA polymerase subunit H (RpoH/RPB5)